MICNRINAPRTRATIYWDESSRGNRVKTSGRWVAERYDYGKRVRFRSTDYGKVLAWAEQSDVEAGLKGGKRQYTIGERAGTGLVGFPGYSVDVATGTVYGIRNKPLKIMGVRLKLSDSHHVRHKFSVARIVWAAKNGIDPRQIPSDICFKRNKDGTIAIHYVKDYCTEVCHRNNSLLITTREQRTTRAVKEGDLLLRYYRNGERQELVKYLILQHEPLATYLHQYKGISPQRAQDIALAAIDHYCQMLERGTLAVTQLTGNLRRHCNTILRNENREKYFNDKIIYNN